MGYIARIDGEERAIDVKRDGETYIVKIGDDEMVVDAFWPERGLASLLIDGKSYEIDVHSDRDRYLVQLRAEEYSFDLFDERKMALKAVKGLGVEGVQEIRTSMPGRIVKVLVEEGQEVEEGAGLVVVEAMKMENEIKSAKAGTVAAVKVKEGETVEAGALLFVVE